MEHMLYSLSCTSPSWLGRVIEVTYEDHQSFIATITACTETWLQSRSPLGNSPTHYAAE
jgi:hypothetical protein